MTASNNNQDDHPTEDEIIDRIYEVAVDPLRFEALMDRWETAIGPQRGAIGPSQNRLANIAHWEGHFERASRIMDRFLAEGDGRDPLARIERSAAFIVERNLHIREANAAATRVLGVTAGMSLSDLALNDSDRLPFSEEIERLFVANDSADRLLRLRSVQGDRLILCSLRLVRPKDQPPHVLAMTSEIDWPKGFSAVLQQAFGLTEAEVAVLQALTEGQSIGRIAETRGRSIDTVRAQIKAVMAKTETRSQTELVRLTISTLELARPTADRVKPEAQNARFETVEPLPFHAIHRPDGRRVEWLEFGDPAGRAVLYLSMVFGLTRWPRSAERAARRLGLRIIVPIRAGFGGSTPLPRRADFLAETADDFDAVCQHLGLGRLPVLALMSDSYLAFQLARQHPQRVRAIIACAGVLPYEGHDQHERMHKWHRFIIAGARFTPALLPFMTKAGFALSNRIGKIGFARAVYAASPADLAAFDDRESREAMLCGSDVVLSEGVNGAETFARDLIAHQNHDWGDDLAALRGTLPVHFVMGAQDPQCPPATLAEWRVSYPWIDFQDHADAGQLVFFSKWRDILPLLDRHSRHA